MIGIWVSGRHQQWSKVYQRIPEIYQPLISEFGFCVIIIAKTEYFDNIPHSVVCIFAQYMGYALADCKAKLRKCFEQYAAIVDKAKCDNISVYYFSRDSIVSQQLWQIAFENINWDSTPDAFVSIQEKAFGSTVARYVEAEHKKTKHATARGLRFTKPAYGCARQRAPQIVDKLKSEEEMNWTISMWPLSKFVWGELLGPSADDSQKSNIHPMIKLIVSRILGIWHLVFGIWYFISLFSCTNSHPNEKQFRVCCGDQFLCFYIYNISGVQNQIRSRSSSLHLEIHLLKGA